MTLTELRYIVSVADEKHFGHAASKCFVSQPTLSIGVKRLEDELGVVLFERSKTGVHLTAIAEQLVDKARNILQEADSFKELSDYVKDPFLNPLRLGAIYTIGPYLFPALLPALKTAESRLKLYIEENFTGMLRQMLKKGQLDAIIVSLPFTEPDIKVHELYREPFEVLLPASHPWNNQSSIPAKEIHTENVLLLGEGHCFRDQVIDACPALSHSSYDRTDMVAGGSSLETLRHMVASGLGVTVLPASAAGLKTYAPGYLSTKPFSDPQPSRSVAIAWRKQFPRTEAIDLLIDVISNKVGAQVNARHQSA